MALRFVLAACCASACSSDPSGASAPSAVSPPSSAQSAASAAGAGASGNSARAQPASKGGTGAAGSGAAGKPAGASGRAGADAADDGTDAGSEGGTGGIAPSAPDSAAVDAGPTHASITAAAPSAMTQAWWSYQRASTYTVVTSDVKVPMRDGIELGCTLSRPGTNGTAADGPFPGLVVEFTPYALNASNNNAEAAFFAERGYNALVCLIRGVGDSGGTWQNAMASQDGRDAHDLVEWLAVQPFSNGRIGQLGESYGGATSYGAAVEQPPHLLAVAPMQPPANLYDDVIYPGGIESTPDGTMNNWPPIAELLSYGAINAQAEYDVCHAHPTFDAFWKDHSLVGRQASIQVPVLTIGGWLDGFFRSGALANIEAALDRTWVIYGPWPHLPVVDIGQCSGGSCVDDPLPSGVLLAWFDHWLLELPDLPIPGEPTFVSFENPKGASQGWRELSGWVPEGTDVMTFELGSDGTLSPTAATSEALSFKEPGEPSAMGAALTFSSAPLDADRVLLGHPTLDLSIALSAADANFYVQLFDVDAQGMETFVNDGFLKASHRVSHETPQPVPIGESVDYHIPIRAQHHRFAAGHQLRIRLSGGPMDTLLPAAPVEVTVETGSRTRLRLPGFAAPP